MTPVALVDSCVLIDYITDSLWADWSAAAMVGCGASLAINAVIYAELSVGFQAVEDCEAALPEAVFERLDLPWPAAFLAGQAHRSYRQAGGKRQRTLPDFLIGAHAAISDLMLITRDPKPYRRYYPRLQLIAPDSHFMDTVP